MSHINPSHKPTSLENALRDYASHFKDDKTTSDGKKYIIIEKGHDKFQVVEKMGFIRSLLSLIFGKAPYTKKEADKYALAEKVSKLHRSFRDIDPNTTKGIDILYKKLHIPDWQPQTKSRSSSQSSTSSSKSSKAESQHKTFIKGLKKRYPIAYEELTRSKELIQLPSIFAKHSITTILEEIQEHVEEGNTAKAKEIRKELSDYLEVMEAERKQQ